VAIFVFHLSVATTVGIEIVEPGIVDTHVVFGALLGVWAAEEKTSKKWHSWGWLTPYQGRDNAANAILRGRN
jgi:hypothetical protein